MLERVFSANTGEGPMRGTDTFLRVSDARIPISDTQGIVLGVFHGAQLAIRLVIFSHSNRH